MHSLLIVALFSLTNLNTGEVLPDALVGPVPSLTYYAQLFNDNRGGQLQSDDGTTYVVSDARVVVLEENEQGNVVYPGQ